MSWFDLDAALQHARQYLPPQKPLERFVHFNALQAFQSHRFHDALAIAAELYGSHSYMPEEEYRACLRTGRITLNDLGHVLTQEVADEAVVPGVSRRHLAELALRFGLDVVDEPSVEFELSDGRARERLREGLPSGSRCTPSLLPLTWRFSWHALICGSLSNSIASGPCASGGPRPTSCVAPSSSGGPLPFSTAAWRTGRSHSATEGSSTPSAQRLAPSTIPTRTC